MKNILIAINAVSLDKPALDFACYLANLSHSTVTGVFLENLVADEKAVWRRGSSGTFLDWDIDEHSEEFQKKQLEIEDTLEYFKKICTKKAVNFKIHRDGGVPTTEIVEESRYADLIVTDSTTSFSRHYEGIPTNFLHDILKDAECPVVIAPEKFEGIDEIIFSYNRTASSVFAMKQFTYLFPELSEKRAIVLQINEEGDWYHQDKERLGEWLQQHYSAVGFEIKNGDVTVSLFDYLAKRKKIFLVMGAYGRTAFSRFFKHSRADDIIKAVPQPLFISHK